MRNISDIGTYAFSGCKRLKTVNYYRRENTLDKITIESDNTPLYDADWKLVIRTETTYSKTPDYDIFSVTPINIPDGATVVFACFNKNRPVGMQIRMYNGENPIYFADFSKNDYDSVKIMVVEDLLTLKPICDFEIITID